MTDKELLELAAKAAGIHIEFDSDGKSYIGNDYVKHWNPLTDDGDALRLAVKLGFEIDAWLLREITIVDHIELNCAVNEDHKNDPYAATRRAIVRAAAEIGKAST